MTVDEFLGELERVRRSGCGWIARCPAHDDSTPSLSVREGEDGRVLVKCHAGCTADKITAALGLRLADLFSGERRVWNAWQPRTDEERRAAEMQRLRRQARHLELENRRAFRALDRATLVLGCCLHIDQHALLERLWRAAVDELEQEAAAAAEESERRRAAAA